MIGSSWVCTLVGHDYETEWIDALNSDLGPAEMEVQECQRCGYRVATGRDRPIEDRQP